MNLPCYSFSNVCQENLELELGDGCHKIFFNASAFEQEKNLEKKSILEYIIAKTSTSDFTNNLDNLVEQTKLNELFRGEYMAWGLAEFDAEQRGYKVGVQDGISQGALQTKLETARKFIAFNIPYEQIAQGTGLPLETVKELAKEIK